MRGKPRPSAAKVRRAWRKAKARRGANGKVLRARRRKSAATAIHRGKYNNWLEVDDVSCLSQGPSTLVDGDISDTNYNEASEIRMKKNLIGRRVLRNETSVIPVKITFRGVRGNTNADVRVSSVNVEVVARGPIR